MGEISVVAGACTGRARATPRGRKHGVGGRSASAGIRAGVAARSDLTSAMALRALQWIPRPERHADPVARPRCARSRPAGCPRAAPAAGTGSRANGYRRPCNRGARASSLSSRWPDPRCGGRITTRRWPWIFRRRHLQRIRRTAPACAWPAQPGRAPACRREHRCAITALMSPPTCVSGVPARRPHRPDRARRPLSQGTISQISLKIDLGDCHRRPCGCRAAAAVEEWFGGNTPARNRPMATVFGEFRIGSGQRLLSMTSMAVDEHPQRLPGEFAQPAPVRCGRHLPQQPQRIEPALLDRIVDLDMLGSPAELAFDLPALVDPLPPRAYRPASLLNADQRRQSRQIARLKNGRWTRARHRPPRRIARHI